MTAGASATIMTQRKLDKIVRQIEALRARGGVSGAELEKVLRKLGRRHDGNGVWRSRHFELEPITVHTHPGDLSRHTKDNTLKSLKDDRDAWRKYLAEGAKG